MTTACFSYRRYRNRFRFRFIIFVVFGLCCCWLTIFNVNTYYRYLFLTTNDDDNNNNFVDEKVHYQNNDLPIPTTTPSSSSSTKQQQQQQTPIITTTTSSSTTNTTKPKQQQQQQLSLLHTNETIQQQQKQQSKSKIIVVGLPKTGTSTIHKFFLKSGGYYNSSHYKCGKYYCGLCISSAIKQNKKPLESCGNYDVYSQMDIENIGQCYLPQIEYLDELYEENPYATWILSTRNVTKWINSATNWIGGGIGSGQSLAARLVKCKVTRKNKKKKKGKDNNNNNNNNIRIGPKSTTEIDLEIWYNNHLSNIRNFTQHHPSLKLIEIDIENPLTGYILSNHFENTKPEYWGHENDSINSKASVMYHNDNNKKQKKR